MSFAAERTAPAERPALLAGHVPPRVVRRATGEALVLDPELLIGAGGEARVFALARDTALVAKVYHHPDAARAAKIEAMLANPPLSAGKAARGVRLAWPSDVLLDEAGAFAGFVMPRAEGPRVFELYNPATRRTRAPECDWSTLQRAGWNLAAAFEALHAAGYVVGDVNESNVVVDEAGGVTLVDADSFQVPVPGGAAAHRCKVGKPEFTPPELQGLAFDEVERTPEHDRFGLAVLLFQLLMEGTHPFAGRFPGLAEAPPVDERIREGWFPYRGMLDMTVVPPRLAPPPEILHPGLRRLFHRAFVDGHARPAARPTAEEWRAALAEARVALVSCPRNARHRYGSHLLSCPWCDRAELLGGRDPFPADAVAAARLPATARAGAVAAAAGSGRTLFGGMVAPVQPGMLPSAPGGGLPAAPAPGAPLPAVHPPGWLEKVGFDNGWVIVSAIASFLAVQTGGQIFLSLVALALGIAGYNDQKNKPARQTTGAWIVIVVAALMMLTGFLGAIGMGAAPDPAGPGWVDEPPPPPVATSVSAPATVLPGAGGEAAVAPHVFGLPLLNQDALDAELRSRLAEGPPLETGTVTVSLRVREDGTVDPQAVAHLSTTHPRLSGVVEEVFLGARFEAPPEPRSTLVRVEWETSGAVAWSVNTMP